MEFDDWKLWDDPSLEMQRQIIMLEQEVGPIEDYHDALQLGIAHPADIIRDAALQYAERGWHVFPCLSTKRPLTKWGKGEAGDLATTDSGQIRQWFGRDGLFPDAVIGIATGPSGLFSLDVDTKNDADLNAFERNYGALPHTLRQETPSGGCQLIFYATNDDRARTTAQVLAEGIDTRGLGGMIVVPPMPQREWEDEAAPIAPAPESILTDLAAKSGRARRGPIAAANTAEATEQDLALARDLASQFRPSENYGEWIFEIAAFHDLTKGSDEGLEITAEWTEDENFPDGVDEVRAKWDSFTVGGGVTVAHLFKRVKAAGGEPYRTLMNMLPGDSAPAGSAPAPADVVKREKAIRTRFQFQSPSEFRRAVEQPTPIVDGFIYGRGQYLLFGAWGLGKTFLAMDLALAIAHRFEKWHGRRLYMDRPVAYLAFEGEYALPSRLAAWEKHHDRKIDEDRVRFWSGHASLIEKEDRDALLASINEFTPGLVVVDTLSAASPGADENGGADMGQILAWGRSVSREAGASVLFVHHPPRHNPRAARGHSTLEANTDGVLRLERARGDGITMVGHKVRCDAPAQPLQLDLLPVDLGQDPKRPERRISGAVVVSADDPLTPMEEIERMVLESVAPGAEVPLGELVAAAAERAGCGKTKARQLLERVVPEGEADSITGLLRERGPRNGWIIKREAQCG